MRRYGVKDASLSREALANPLGKVTYYERLSRSQSIDLRNNYQFEDLGNGYSRILPIDEKKRFGCQDK